MYTFYNPKTKKYINVHTTIAVDQNGHDPELCYEFSYDKGLLYTSLYKEDLEKILDCRDGKRTSDVGTLDMPYGYKQLLDGYKVVELLGHKEPIYRISSSVHTGYEIVERDFDGTISECLEHLDTYIRDADRNSLLKDIKLKIDGMIHRDTLYDITKFIIEKNILGE